MIIEIISDDIIDEAAATTGPAAWDESGAAGRLPGNNIHNHNQIHVISCVIFCTHEFKH